MSKITQAQIANLQNNGVVAYPTSTLPGLGCLPNKQALDNLYKLKNRPHNQPVSLGVATIQQAESLVEVPEFAKLLLDNFPLGSITLILDAVNTLDARLGGDRVAVRVLADETAIELVTKIGPITATSANHSGVQPLHNVRDAADVLGLSEESIVDGNCPGGNPSTILSLSKDEENNHGYTVSIMREGVVPSNDVNTWLRSLT